MASPAGNSIISEDEQMETEQGPQQDLSITRAGQMPIVYEEPSFWCSIAYYELDHRAGNYFQASENMITIDGGTDPSSRERFCVGSVPNIHRTQAIEINRRNIGGGLRLYYIGGQVYVDCLSEKAIFVQSPNANMHHKWHPATVVKVPPECHLMIFDNQDFAAALTKAVDKGYNDVFHLTRMCQIRISFVKGWGEKYKRRAITECPCWIEIFLHGPSQWLDRVLKEMGKADGTCQSNT